MLFDEFVGVTATLQGRVPEVIYQQIIPVAVMVLLIAILGLLIWKIYRPTRREMIIAFFTGFVVCSLSLQLLVRHSGAKVWICSGHGMSSRLTRYPCRLPNNLTGIVD